MKQNRYLPFGYIVESGKIIPCESEVNEIKWIYSSYLSGMSYLTIAGELTKRQVHYLKNRCDWNKNRVKRILENSKYLGTDMLPTIITEQEYQAVQALILSKTADYREPPQDIKQLRGIIFCKTCGKTLKRHKTHGVDLWRCDNKSCKVYINHQTLMQKLGELIAYLTENQNLISTSGKEPEVTDAEVAWLNTAFKTELQSPVLDEDKAKSLIFACAVAEYNRVDDGKTAEMAQSIKDSLTSGSLETIALDSILEIASRVYITKEKSLQAELKTGQLIP